MKRKLSRYLAHRRAKSAIKFLQKMDRAMHNRGYNHQQKRQAWRDFVTSPASREQALAQLFDFYERIK